MDRFCVLVTLGLLIFFTKNSFIFDMFDPLFSSSHKTALACHEGARVPGSSEVNYKCFFAVHSMQFLYFDCDLSWWKDISGLCSSGLGN